MSSMPLSRLLCLVTAISGWAASASDRPGSGPHAWVLSPDEGASAEWLTRAGFTVTSLPLDRSPVELSGLVVLGAEASDMPEYHAYMHAHAEDLADFVEQGGVVLQLAQDAEVEPAPPFLPTTLAARRGAGPSGGLQALAHPLLAGIDVADALASGDGFVEHVGFTQLISAVDAAGPATLLVGAHGRGEVLLVAIPLDRPGEAREDRNPLADAFASNLARHVDCLRRHDTADCTAM